MEWILKEENFQTAIRNVKRNKGAAGVDGMTVEELDGYFAAHGEEIKAQIRAKQYKPQPVRRVYIPKANGKQRPLGIHKAESVDSGMGELLQDWKHEGLHEGVQSMDAAEGSGSNSKAVETPKDHLPKPAKAESLQKVQLLRRGNFQGCEYPARMV